MYFTHFFISLVLRYYRVIHYYRFSQMNRGIYMHTNFNTVFFIHPLHTFFIFLPLKHSRVITTYTFKQTKVFMCTLIPTLSFLPITRASSGQGLPLRYSSSSVRSTWSGDGSPRPPSSSVYGDAMRLTNTPCPSPLGRSTRCLFLHLRRK